MKEKGFILCMTMIFLSVIALMAMTVVEKSVITQRSIENINQYKMAFAVAEVALLENSVPASKEFIIKKRQSEKAVDDCVVLRHSVVQVFSGGSLVITMHVKTIDAYDNVCQSLQKIGRMFWWVD